MYREFAGERGRGRSQCRSYNRMAFDSTKAHARRSISRKETSPLLSFLWHPAKYCERHRVGFAKNSGTRQAWWILFGFIYRLAIGATGTVRNAEVTIAIPRLKDARIRNVLLREASRIIEKSLWQDTLHGFAAGPRIEPGDTALTVSLGYRRAPRGRAARGALHRQLLHDMQIIIDGLDKSKLRGVKVSGWRWVRMHLPQFPSDLSDQEVAALQPVWKALPRAADLTWCICKGCGRLIPVEGHASTCPFCQARWPDKVQRSRAVQREGGIFVLLPEEVLGELPPSSPLSEVLSDNRLIKMVETLRQSDSWFALQERLLERKPRSLGTLLPHIEKNTSPSQRRRGKR
jgi:hypothetical protein